MASAVGRAKTGTTTQVWSDANLKSIG
jgi:hypothetical protein